MKRLMKASAIPDIVRAHTSIALIRWTNPVTPYTKYAFCNPPIGQRTSATAPPRDDRSPPPSTTARRIAAQRLHHRFAVQPVAASIGHRSTVPSHEAIWRTTSNSSVTVPGRSHFLESAVAVNQRRRRFTAIFHRCRSCLPSSSLLDSADGEKDRRWFPPLPLATAAAADRTKDDGGEVDTVDILRHSRTEEDLTLDSTASWFGREKRKEERRHRRTRRRRTMSESREYFLLQSPPTIVVHASSPVHEKGRGAISALTLIAAPLCQKSFSGAAMSVKAEMAPLPFSWTGDDAWTTMVGGDCNRKYSRLSDIVRRRRVRRWRLSSFLFSWPNQLAVESNVRSSSVRLWRSMSTVSTSPPSSSVRSAAAAVASGNGGNQRRSFSPSAESSSDDDGKQLRQRWKMAVNLLLR
nr:hypothetical protein Iba_chr12dCG9720 [Ipomoea batatas]